SLQRNDAGVWLCEYPGLSFQRSPVCACSLVSSLLLSGATMSQQSSLTQSAHSVRQVLTAYRFQEMAARLSDGTAPLAGPHLSWLDEIIAQAMVGEITADVNEQRLAIVHFRRMDFLGRLTDVEVAARHAQKHLDSKLLRRARTSENRALRTLV